MWFLYNLSISFFGMGIRIYSLFNAKAGKWVSGRKNWEENLEQNLKGRQDLIWMHCSSLGEFEQGRPILEALHKKGQQVLLTFFSPSGYENLKNYKYAEHVCYLPLDTASNARKFLKIVRPKTAIFIKYEFWYNYIQALHEQKTPLFLISGIFRPGHHFFKPYGSWFANRLKSFTYLFVQDESSLKLLNSIGIHQANKSGDTRFDRVIDIASAPKDVPKAAEFSANQKVLVAGSTWPEDEDLLIEELNQHSDLKMIIAPHNVDVHHLQRLSEKLKDQCNFYSSEDFDKSKKVLIIDQIGLLSSIYRYGQMAYIGGGFGKGIHNTLEAAVYGLPLAFGPHYQKFKEARDLIDVKGAFSIENTKDLKQFIDIMNQEDVRKSSGDSCRNYVLKNKGASELILRIFEERSLI